jgi:hypothetical protein
MERAMGIETTSEAWGASAATLPNVASHNRELPRACVWLDHAAYRPRNIRNYDFDTLVCLGDIVVLSRSSFRTVREFLSGSNVSFECSPCQLVGNRFCVRATLGVARNK